MIFHPAANRLYYKMTSRSHPGFTANLLAGMAPVFCCGTALYQFGSEKSEIGNHNLKHSLIGRYQLKLVLFCAG